MHACIALDNNKNIFSTIIQAIMNRKSKQKHRVAYVNSHTFATKINCHELKLTILTHSNSILRGEKVRKTTAKYIISITNV